jgi:hypothetical protein
MGPFPNESIRDISHQVNLLEEAPQTDVLVQRSHVECSYDIPNPLIAFKGFTHQSSLPSPCAHRSTKARGQESEMLRMLKNIKTLLKM